MKLKKLLALVLALIMMLSCMCITSYAEDKAFSKDITVNVPKIVIGTTAADLLKNITLAGETIPEDVEIADVLIYDSTFRNTFDVITEAGTYYLTVILSLKSTSDFTVFNRIGDSSYDKTVTFAGDNKFTDGGCLIGHFDSTTKFTMDDHYIFNACMQYKSFTAYTGFDNLDTDTNSSKEIIQYYDATVTTETSDYTKVQVSWTLKDIEASVEINKIWDTDKLEWVDDSTKGNSATADAVTAEFNFVNYSSVKVEAKVEFKAEDGITAEATYKENSSTEFKDDGTIALETKADDAEADNTGKVYVNVPADLDYFKTLETKVDGGTYGKYTVTISKYVEKP